MKVLNPRCATIFKNDSCEARSRRYCQVIPRHDRSQISAGSTATFIADLGKLYWTHAFLLCTIEIRVERVTRFNPSINELPVYGHLAIAILHIQRATYTMIIIFPPLLVHGFLEIGQHILISPPDVSLLPPAIVVRGMPTDVNHAIDGA